MNHNLDKWVAVGAVAIGQPCQVWPAEWYLLPTLSGQPDAFPAANGCEPTTKPLWICELVDVFQAV